MQLECFVLPAHVRGPVVTRSGPRGLAGVASIGAILTSLAGCSPGPLNPPIIATPMNKPVALSSTPGSGEIEAERRVLEGTWELIALELAPPVGDGARMPVAATGTLTYDEFGNLTIDAHTTDAAAPVAAREATVLSFKGRAVLDPAKRELKLMDLTGNVNPDEVLSPERRRRYVFDADTLTLSSFDDGGQVTAVATWRRRQ